MSDLICLLRQAHDTVNWFSLGDAKRLAGEIASTVRACDKAPDDPKSRASLVAAATAARDFLSHRDTPAALGMARRLRAALAAAMETAS